MPRERKTTRRHLTNRTFKRLKFDLERPIPQERPREGLHHDQLNEFRQNKIVVIPLHLLRKKGKGEEGQERHQARA